jgi:ribosomal protein S18 acetylase RimI-like enzyme
VDIRPLTPQDVAAYRQLRLASLREHPLAYVTDLSEEEQISSEEMEGRLAAASPARTFGVFQGDDLVGIGTLVRSTRIRLAFRATIVGMYILPPFRRQGAASRLLEACMARARTFPEVEEVCLAVTVGNDAARQTYLKFGFQPEYVEPRYFKHARDYYDMEWMRLPLK